MFKGYIDKNIILKRLQNIVNYCGHKHIMWLIIVYLIKTSGIL